MDAPGCREVVDDEVTGFLVPIGDAAALSDKIEYLLNAPDVCRRFGAAGRRKERCWKNSMSGSVFRKTYAIYQELGI